MCNHSLKVALRIFVSKRKTLSWEYGGTDILFSAPLVAIQEIGDYSVKMFVYVHIYMYTNNFKKTHMYIYIQKSYYWGVLALNMQD